MSEAAAIPGNAVARADDAVQVVEFDRRRLIATMLLSGLAAVATWCAVAVTVTHVGLRWAVPTGVDPVDAIFARHDAIPWWAALALIPAALFASVRFLRNVYRLQDGEPALVLSSRGLQFRPSVLDERVRVPWSAIRRVTPRRVKNHRAIALTIDDIDRHVPRSGPLAGLRRLARLQRNTIVVATPMSRTGWKDLVAELQRRVAAPVSAIDNGQPRRGAGGTGAARNGARNPA